MPSLTRNLSKPFSRLLCTIGLIEAEPLASLPPFTILNKPLDIGAYATYIRNWSLEEPNYQQVYVSSVKRMRHMGRHSLVGHEFLVASVYSSKKKSVVNIVVEQDHEPSLGSINTIVQLFNPSQHLLAKCMGYITFPSLSPSPSAVPPDKTLLLYKFILTLNRIHIRSGPYSPFSHKRILCESGMLVMVSLTGCSIKYKWLYYVQGGFKGAGESQHCLILKPSPLDFSENILKEIHDDLDDFEQNVRDFRQEKLEKRLDELRVALTGTFRDINNEIDTWCQLEERCKGIVRLEVLFGQRKHDITKDDVRLYMRIWESANTWWSWYDWYRDEKWDATEIAIGWVERLYCFGNGLARRMHDIRTHLPDCHLDTYQ